MFAQRQNAWPPHKERIELAREFHHALEFSELGVAKVTRNPAVFVFAVRETTAGAGPIGSATVLPYERIALQCRMEMMNKQDKPWENRQIGRENLASLRF